MSLYYDFQKRTMVTLASIAISLTVGLLLINFGHGQGQSVENFSADDDTCTGDEGTLCANGNNPSQAVKFKTYTNNDMKFSIQHPSNWEPGDTDDGVYFQIRENPEDKIEFGDSDLSIVPSSYFRVNVEKVEPELDYNTMTLQNKSIEQYVQGTIDVMPLNSETLLRQNRVTVGGNDGILVEYTSNENDKDYYGYKVLTIADGKLYTLSYEEKPLRVPETLPLVNQMVDSFQIKEDNQDKTNNLSFEEYEKKYCPEYSDPDEHQLLVLCSPREVEESDDVPAPPQD